MAGLFGDGPASLDKSLMYYFASPYSDPQKAVRGIRYHEAIRAAGLLIREGYMLIEPIAMSHPTSLIMDLPTGYEFWKARDRAFIDRSDAVIVLTLSGWLESIGVTDELHYAIWSGKPVYAYTPPLIDNVLIRSLNAEAYIDLHKAIRLEKLDI